MFVFVLYCNAMAVVAVVVVMLVTALLMTRYFAVSDELALNLWFSGGCLGLTRTVGCCEDLIVLLLVIRSYFGLMVTCRLNCFAFMITTLNAAPSHRF